MPIVGRDWSHTGVAELFTKIKRSGYLILYLTARAIGQADATRDYLFGLTQKERDKLPGQSSAVAASQSAENQLIANNRIGVFLKYQLLHMMISLITVPPEFNSKEMIIANFVSILEKDG